MKSRSRWISGLVIVLCLVLSACAGAPAAPTTGGGGAVSTSAPGQGDSQTVVIRNFAFSPADITIHVGQTVVWRNDDSTPHTATSGSCSGGTCTTVPGWDSGTLNQGQSFSHAFDSAGTFTYYCKIHGSTMQATVTVTP